MAAVPETVAAAAGGGDSPSELWCLAGAAVWLTEKLTDSEAPQLPAVSRAFAMILCAPSATVTVPRRSTARRRCQSRPGGRRPTTRPSLSPLASLAFAARLTVPPTVAPAAGLVTATAGFTVSSHRNERRGVRRIGRRIGDLVSGRAPSDQELN